ncbi:MAG: hypothetical protein ABI844_07615 [Saprospiraceae bacterium]
MFRFADISTFLAGSEFTLKKQFLEGIQGKNLIHSITSLRILLLLLHSSQDDTVGIENTANIYKAAMHPKSFIFLDGADHLLSNPDDSAYVGLMIVAWLRRHLS